MARVNSKQVEKTAAFIKQLPDNGQMLNFYSFKNKNLEIVATDMYPPLNNPHAINFFFFVCLHQFGFWYGDTNGYLKPLVGHINGKKAKGSTLVWKASKRAFDQCPAIFDPVTLSTADPDDIFHLIFSDDNGPIPFPNMEKRLQISRDYGRWFVENHTSPKYLTEKANACDEPLLRFLGTVREIPGYNRDCLEKKNMLLAMTLVNRPEKLLVAKPTDPAWMPIVDYHVMRVALRLGFLYLEQHECDALRARQWIDASTEKNIRLAVYQAVKLLIKLSGHSMFFIDKLLWQAREYCPEMSTPDCDQCVLTTVCNKYTELFQPVFRTTAY